ncbi:hypothetical protein H1R20_g1010, partial [Candolleomyces eurysporus]
MVKSLSSCFIPDCVWRVRILPEEALVCDRANNSSLRQSMYGTHDAGFYGYSYMTGGFAGGHAEYVHVPRGYVSLSPILNHIPDEQALYLSDILPTSYRTVVDTGVGKADTVAIWGLDLISLYAAKWAQIKGTS